MRDYGKTTPQFWTGKTGRKMRGNGPLQAVAHYLFTCGSATMTGLYYVPVPTIVHETGHSLATVTAALRWLARDGFSHYDFDLALVFVKGMVVHQVGETLDERDKRRKGVIREVSRFKDHRFARMFWNMYADAYHLPPLDGGKATPARNRAAPPKKKRRTPPPPPAADDDFERFWKVTNQDGSKQEARQTWVKHGRPPADTLIAMWRKWCATPKWKRGARFQLPPVRWLRGRMYEQEPPQIVVGNSNGAPPKPDPTCEFHRVYENRNKRPKQLKPESCADCKHIASWIRKDDNGGPETIGEMLKKGAS